MNVVSLFAGCGGLDLGFERAGFNIVWANEYDSSIHETYKKNHPNTVLNTQDIRELTGDDIPECDGIIGGPPCQSWSEGGKQLGIEDPRGQLFFDYIRIVKDKKPKFFVIENVQGILAKKHKKALDYFLFLLNDAGYRISYELLNAADYKVPQDRFRVFFIGIRNDLSNRFTFPNAVTLHPITLRQAISDITEMPRFFDEEQVVSNNTERPNHDVYAGIFDQKFMSRNRVRSWDEPSFTMQALAKNAPIHPQAPKMTYINESRRIFAKGFEHLYRRLSVRECARIQTFPDNFRFYYTDIKDGYKMVGNAVPPRLAYYLAVQMRLVFANEMNLSASEHKTLKSITEPVEAKRISSERIKENYPDKIVVNKSAHVLNISCVDLSKNVLVSLVKEDNSAIYLNQNNKIYYTGRHFPSTIALNKLYYFIPYIKGKGIKDLYLIKIARIGTKQEVYPECADNDSRLVFELEFVKQIFDSYQPIHLNIWHTFTDTTLMRLISIKED